MKWLLLTGVLLVADVAAGTLTCGELPCSDAVQAHEPWPTTKLDEGFPVRDRSRLEIDIPAGFERVTHLSDSIIFHYPDEDEKSVTIISLKIPRAENNGPMGGWDLLRSTRKGALEVYFYQEVDEKVPTYSANIFDAGQKPVNGARSFIVVMTQGFSQGEFKAVFGSVRSITRGK